MAIGFVSAQDRKQEEILAHDNWVETTLKNLSLEKKVAQLVCTDITGEYLPNDDPKFKMWEKLVVEYGIGGFVVYGGTPKNVAFLLNHLQSISEIPILISVDFEGGPGQQVKGASEFPGNMGFAATRNPDLMYQAAKVMAKEGRAMGYHLTYTPVSDISLFPDNPQESVRSFGGDIMLLSGMLKAYVKGFKEEGMLTTAKHFPGRGNMIMYNDFPGFNYLDRTAEQMETEEFKAFGYAIDAGVDFIMTEHLAVPSITGGSKLPASVEPKLVKDIIKKKLSFDGIITTDDLWYDYVVDRFGEEEVAVMALQAGHDIVLKPKNPIKTIKEIVKAVKTGRISEEQINGSVMKLLKKKEFLGLQKNRLVDIDLIGEIVGNEKHQALINKVADYSVTLLKNENALPIINLEDSKIFHLVIQKEEVQPTTPLLLEKMKGAFKQLESKVLKPNQAKLNHEEILDSATDADVIFLSFLVQRNRHGDPAPIGEKEKSLINQIILDNKSKKVIAMSYGNPHIIKEIEGVNAFATGYGEGGWYGNQPVYIASFIKMLKGKLEPKGRLPITVSKQYPIGYGLGYDN